MGKIDIKPIKRQPTTYKLCVIGLMKKRMTHKKVLKDYLFLAKVLLATQLTRQKVFLLVAEQIKENSRLKKIEKEIVYINLNDKREPRSLSFYSPRHFLRSVIYFL